MSQKRRAKNKPQSSQSKVVVSMFLGLQSKASDTTASVYLIMLLILGAIAIYFMYMSIAFQ